MSLLNVMKISASGMSAERLRMDTIADNLANANTTRAANGGPYQRKVVIFEPILQGELRGGTRVARIERDTTPFRQVYEPGHPNADSSGYVLYPNVDMAHEMVDMITASRAYEANITAFNAAKGMVMRALEIGR